MCVHCVTWYHAACLGLSRPGFQYYLTHPDIDWECYRCALPNLGDSFFLPVEDTDHSDTFLSQELDTCNDHYESNACEDSLNWYDFNIKAYYKSKVKIAHLNINMILNKLDEVKEMLNRGMFDMILFIAETKLTTLYRTLS